MLGHLVCYMGLLEVLVLDISCSPHLCLMLPLSLDLACACHGGLWGEENNPNRKLFG